MKNKTVRLLLSILLIVILAIIILSRESPRDTLPLNEVWAFRADDYILATPIQINDQIIFRTANKIYSISAVDGSKNWEIAARASDITINVNLIGKPLVGNSKFLVSEEQGNSISIYSTKTGKRLWNVEGQVNSINAPIELVDDIMAVARHDGNLVVYDLISHQKLWEIALLPRTSTPIAANSDLITVGMGDELRIYGLKDGSIVNEKPYAESSVAEIMLSGPNIFVGIANNGDWRISSLQLASLYENWVFHAGKINHPYLASTSDYLSLFNQTLLLLNIENGDVVWQGDLQEYYSAPVFHQNNFYFVSKQKMFDRKRKMCKVEIGKGTMEGCSMDSAVKVFETLQPPGLLVADNLLIVPQDSELAAFKIP